MTSFHKFLQHLVQALIFVMVIVTMTLSVEATRRKLFKHGPHGGPGDGPRGGPHGGSYRGPPWNHSRIEH